MKTITLNYPWDKELTDKSVVLAVGFFDGVHRGHQKLINDAKAIALEKNIPLMVMTFNHHPQELFSKNKISYITTNEEKALEMEKLGVDYLVIINFTREFSQLSPQEYVDNVLLKLKVDTVVAGFDYTYGPDKSVDNVQNLPKFAKGKFKVKVEPKQTFYGEKIGSTSIRQAIKNGNFPLVKKLLGYPYKISGEIVHGYRRGHQLGFPTANLKINPIKALPKEGVYATRVKIDNKWYEAMTNVGYNDTFDNKELTIEANLFDFSEEAYGKQMTIEWYKFMRGEIKFDSLDGLIDQMKRDEQDIKDYFQDN
ncbi:riboflavin kinase/FMN adenylyltransferase [Lactobacillus colini]|uniref:Riboflavin biosynthesis protein n=1 Tax=Lactobacillus colini TaxID=1819254 RepID=A0ABS4MDE4_9LACO|nr:riboflavin biosynthesis protein RibF [Lactobacillus colini]MBP2057712.1 riboflavin kinase/FMN adenylyltransferase [Lactobacillus colini]